MLIYPIVHLDFSNDDDVNIEIVKGCACVLETLPGMVTPLATIPFNMGAPPGISTNSVNTLG